MEPMLPYLILNEAPSCRAVFETPNYSDATRKGSHASKSRGTSLELPQGSLMNRGTLTVGYMNIGFYTVPMHTRLLGHDTVKVPKVLSSSVPDMPIKFLVQGPSVSLFAGRLAPTLLGD